MEDYDIPIKIGYLKEDLYSFYIEYDNNDHDVFITKSEVNSIIEDIKSNCHIGIMAGTKFECYQDDGEELWYVADNLGGLQYDSEWAEKHLENIMFI